MIRLSDKFLLLDFLYGYRTYKKVQMEGKLDWRSRITDENLREGEQLCRNLLEPIVERYDTPISIGEGLRMEGIRENYPGSEKSPHGWTTALGSAADIVVHDWVNRDKAPINFLWDLSRNCIHYHRAISYAGSEICCVTHKTSEMHYKLRENRLVENQKKSGIGGKEYSGYDNWKKRAEKEYLQGRDDWRRKPYWNHHMRGDQSTGVRPWHVRVSRYFVLHDFCRNLDMFARGMATVPELNEQTAKSEIKVARMMGEVLDPVKKLLGNLSVVRGWEPEGFAKDKDAKRHRWIAGPGNRYSVRFVTPVDPDKGYLDLLNNDDRVEVPVTTEDLPCGGHLVHVDIKDFDPSPSDVRTSASGREFPWEAEA